jgi:hypothetical protein
MNSTWPPEYATGPTAVLITLAPVANVSVTWVPESPPLIATGVPILLLMKSSRVVPSVYEGLVRSRERLTRGSRIPSHSEILYLVVLMHRAVPVSRNPASHGHELLYTLNVLCELRGHVRQLEVSAMPLQVPH